MKTKKNEELQSRREFFKKAAKGALPILGALALSQVSSVLSAAEKMPMGCQYGCTSSCYGSCSGHCNIGCSGGCTGSCGGCRGACMSSCTRSLM